MIGREFKRRASAADTYPARVRVVGQLGSDARGPRRDRRGGRPRPVARRPARRQTGYRAAAVPDDAPADDAPDSPEATFARAAAEQPEQD